MGRTARSHPETVTVEISGSKEDARVVFDVLRSCFASDRGADEEPQQLHETRPMVWLGTYDVADAREVGRMPVRLGAAVQADVQGGYWAVDRFRTTLDSLFTVQETCAASGDQERDLHLRLESR
ncbi:hypothetical protein LK07_31490 [Streptomyces pluripotens]|uniref:Uncharacterized protein n=1 Tax=Streptomyces pluripotens TaxID=1355015 RepID=A0A221P967_9ACTN|nr:MULTISPECIES: hypothetical protein [Streptomyces]ARP74554.1 hypothetical protein LK06_030300 [Streptomyces pluripotens]ASN28829.1 hypothetical protein LK07_31490 [Streptomyces pluripotens]MCH0557273.1 hypothetical protein [Streptomyces sp. MUM 16J]